MTRSKEDDKLSDIGEYGIGEDDKWRVEGNVMIIEEYWNNRSWKLTIEDIGESPHYKNMIEMKRKADEKREKDKEKNDLAQYKRLKIKFENQ